MRVCSPRQRSNGGGCYIRASCERVSYYACMLRTGAPRRTDAVYWWTEEIARLREACICSRHRYTLARRRRIGDGTTVARMYEAYCEARWSL
jgi:hypothetical protein